MPSNAIYLLISPCWVVPVWYGILPNAAQFKD